jgi:hypothetical protein
VGSCVDASTRSCVLGLGVGAWLRALQVIVVVRGHLQFLATLSCDICFLDSIFFCKAPPACLCGCCMVCCFCAGGCAGALPSLWCRLFLLALCALPVVAPPLFELQYAHTRGIGQRFVQVWICLCLIECVCFCALCAGVLDWHMRFRSCSLFAAPDTHAHTCSEHSCNKQRNLKLECLF